MKSTNRVTSLVLATLYSKMKGLNNLETGSRTNVFWCQQTLLNE